MRESRRGGDMSALVEASARAQAVLAGYEAHRVAAADAIDHFRRARIRVAASHSGEWGVIALDHRDSGGLGAIAAWGNLKQIDAASRVAFETLAYEVPPALKAAKANEGIRRLLSGAAKRRAAADAAARLLAYQGWAGAPATLAALTEYEQELASRADQVRPGDALKQGVWFDQAVVNSGGHILLCPAEQLSRLPRAINDLEARTADADRHRDSAAEAATTLRTAAAHTALQNMPIDRVRETTGGRVRVAPLEAAGIRTVAQLMQRERQLTSIPGVGEVTAGRLVAAARTLWQTAQEEARIDLDPRMPTATTTAVVRSLLLWDTARRQGPSSADVSLGRQLRSVAEAIDRGAEQLVIDGSASHPPRQLVESADRIIARSANLQPVRRPDADPWRDFESRPADYFAMLDELGLNASGHLQEHGDLPSDVIDAVRRLKLRDEYIIGSLRGYQSFAARFALVQRKVLIGDEMGLGKTFEAIAVMAHLCSSGARHFMVICPAAVVTNWMREVEEKSKLAAHRLHGPDRDAAARRWSGGGGVAVTTFESLRWFDERVSSPAIACLVVDEAQYVKNPAAQRSRRTSALVLKSDRAMLLTGTPLENRLDEFAVLVRYLRPDLAVSADGMTPRQFRRRVAPVYLRRNQEDVLTEIPELVEVQEGIPMSTEDLIRYRDAVSAGNFMAMRQAAMLSGTASSKMQRIIDLVAEAEANGRRVIVFSYFREVLDTVARHIPGRVHGPITGSVSAADRQRIIDEFSHAQHGAVLASQIMAGGVGLNIQAASVVIICEPQLKPTTEWQAIARARRMGQLHRVQVHRLLSDEGVDQSITRLLVTKSQLFDSFARESEIASRAPDARDISEIALARQVVAEEQQRLLGGAPV